MNEFDLPKVNEENQEQPNNIEEVNKVEELVPEQPIIEQPNQEGAGSLILFTIMNALIIFGLHYATLNYTTKALYAIPIVIVVLTIITAAKYQKKNDYPTSLLLSGVLCGIVTFLLSFKLDQDLYTHYAIITAATGIIGYTISATINGLIANKNKTGMQILGPILYIGLLIGGAYYAIQKYPNQVNKYLFYNKAEIIATTEEEYIKEILKIRYGQKFICDKELRDYVGSLPRKEDDITKVQNKITKERRLMTYRYCIDENKNLFTVTSTEYDKSKNQYIVQDTYLDTLKLDVIKEELTTLLKDTINPTNIKIYMYSKNNCLFYGDCATNEYFDNLANENDIEKQFSKSKELDFKKQLTLSPKEFVNNNSFKYQINIYGNYESIPDNQLAENVDKILDALNNEGLKNTSGYEIEIYTNYAGDLQVKLITAEGKSGNSFADPDVKIVKK